MPILPLQLDHIWWSRFMLQLIVSINLRNNFTSTGQVMSVAFSNVEYSKLVQKWLSTYMYKTLLDPSLILRSLQFNQANYLQNFYQENVSRLQCWWSKLENVSSMEGTKILRAVHPLWLCNWSTAKRAAGDCRWAPLAQDVPTRSHYSIHFICKADATHPCCFSSLGLLACSLWFFLTMAMTMKMTKSVWWKKKSTKITPMFANTRMN